VQPAVFVDRDGTLIEEKNYLSNPADVELVPGAAEAVRGLRAAGFRVVVISNQAGVARGFFGEDAVRAVHARIDALLGREGAAIDGYYFCPHHPDFSGECRCRKPKPGMLEDAARDLDLDLSRSYMVGDRLTDVEAGGRLGLPGLLVLTGYGASERDPQSPEAHPAAVVADLGAAAEWILGHAAERG